MAEDAPDLLDLDYQAVFDASLDASFILSLKGHILAANKTAVTRYGYSLQKLKQMNIADLTASELKSKVSSRLAILQKAGAIFEWKHRCKDGSELSVEISSQPITFYTEPAILSNARDISHRKSLESELHKQKHLLERILDTEPGTVYIYDLLKKQNVYINRHWLAIYGFSPDEAQAMDTELVQLLHPDDRARVAANLEAWKHAVAGETRSIEYRLRDKAGHWRWLLSRETPFTFADNGEVCQILGIAHDISQRKRAETLRSRQSQVLEMVAAGAPLNDILTALIGCIEDQVPGMLASVLLLDAEGVHLSHGAAPSLPESYVAAIDGASIGPSAGSCGTAAYRKAAVYVEDIATDPLWVKYKTLALPHGLRACWSMPIFDAQKQVLGTFAMYYREPGLPRPEHLQLLAIASHIGAIAISRHKEEEALRNSENRFSILFDKAALPAVLTRLPDHVIVDVNEAWLQMFGYTKAELIGKTSLEVGISRDAEHRARTIGEIRLHDSVRKVEQTLFSKSGIAYTVLVNVNTVVINGQDYAIASLQDITERKRAEAALQESEAKLRLFIHYSPSAIAMFDSDMRYLSYSQRWLSDYNLGEQELTGRSHYEVFPGLPEYWKAIHSRCLAGAIEKNEGEKFLRADGTVDWVRWEIHPWHRAEGGIAGIIIFTEVITERKVAEARVQRLTQLYAALSQCNQAMVRCTSEAELLPQICRDVVSYGGMKMAWIGMLDKASQMVEPVASFGTGIEYLDGLDISAAAEHPNGNGPTGRCIREDQPYWCQDFQQDPVTAVWHERGAKFFWGASASLPLHSRGRVIGAFNVYTTETYAFDESVQQLLVEMAMDISYALDRFISEAERKRSEVALQKSEHYLRTIIETEPECVKVITKSGELVHMNPAGLMMLEATSLEQVREYGLMNFILPDYREPFQALHQRVMCGETASLEFEIKGLKGTRRWMETHAAPLRDANDEITTLLGITRDITERKHSEEHIEYLANFDSLTGLPNRAQLNDHLKYALSLARRSKSQLALMFIDVDRFKDINDTLGHSIGDAFLIEIAKRLQLVLREEDIASRLGGDEFILMLPNNGADGAARVAEKVLEVISQPYQIEQYDLAVTASIGIALYPEDGVDLETLSRSADTAMYRAKHEGRDGYRFFTIEMQSRATRNMQLINAMRYALDNDQFYLHFQPQVSIADGSIIGVEALLRWWHPELGQVSPAEFIPVAEDSGLILPIGEWVLRTAIQQLKRWMDSGYAPMMIAVNLSAIQFRLPGLQELVTHILKEERLLASYLELELTEGVAMHDPQGAIEVMDSLDELGIRMSIDDFGTGYSSLNYLKKFKAYKLKIDQSFVRDINTDVEDRAIVAAIISMAKNLGLRTIAEGVETAEQLEYLRSQGCDEAQGYYFSKPLPADQLELFLSGSKTLVV